MAPSSSSNVKRKKSRKGSKLKNPDQEPVKGDDDNKKTKRRGSSFVGVMLFRIVLVVVFMVALTLFELWAMPDNDVPALRSKAFKRPPIKPVPPDDGLVEEVISELESVIIATSFDPETEAQKHKTKVLKCVKKDQVDQAEVTESEDSGDGALDDGGDEDAGDGEEAPPKKDIECEEDEVAVYVVADSNDEDSEDPNVVADFDHELNAAKDPSDSIGVPNNFQVKEIAHSFGANDGTGLSHHVKDPMFGNADASDMEMMDGDGKESDDPSKRYVKPEDRVPDPEFVKFQAQLRSSGRTYSHVKNAPLEKALKAAGYKQSTKGAKKSPFITGQNGEACTAFPKGEQRLSFCLYHLPWYREQEHYVLLKQYEEEHPSIKPKLKVADFFPPTFRLYKQNERKELKARIADTTLENEGGPYVTKFTFSHGAGTPSLTAKMWDLLKRSDHSNTIQEKEAKQKKIVQQYINHPYLFENRKFIIRNWAVIISSKPLIAYYKFGALFRSIEKYSPFVKRDVSFKRHAHFTNEQKSHKGTLRSSSIYFSLDQFSNWLDSTGVEEKGYVNKVMKPAMKARMMYAMESMFKAVNRNELDGHTGKRVALSGEAAVLQQISFDFLMDETKKLWLLGVNTGVNSFVNLGGDTFRPNWKVDQQESLTTKFVELSEEVLWRKLNKKPISSFNLFTHLNMHVLIDESLPGWDSEEMLLKAINGELTEEEIADEGEQGESEGNQDAQEGEGDDSEEQLSDDRGDSDEGDEEDDA